MILEKPKQIILECGSTAFSVAEFNNGNSCIIVDDGCWVVCNSGRFSSWIYPEAMRHLKLLPNNPNEYQPYLDALKALST